jgi:hypothetical protein
MQTVHIETATNVGDSFDNPALFFPGLVNPCDLRAE